MSGEQRAWSGASDMRQEGHSPHSGREGEAPRRCGTKASVLSRVRRGGFGDVMNRGTIPFSMGIDGGPLKDCDG